MSLSIALSSALSGISLTARGTQIVANNIANAQTEGYGVRSLAQSARVLGSLGTGVSADGTIRQTNPGLIAELRNATTQNNRDTTIGSFWQRMETGMGLPGDHDSLSNRLVGFESALQQASILPDQPSVLVKVAQAADDVVRSLRGLGQLIRQERDNADAAIAQDISWLNGALEDIADLNLQIQRQTLLGGEPAGLMDARQSLIDKVAGVITVREYPRDDGRILLMGEDGTILVDRTAAKFEFKRTFEPEAHEFVESGALSHVSINGLEIASQSALFSAGRIGANLQIRDQSAPQVQDRLDRVAVDLVHRFSSPDIDPTLASGELGIFSVDGMAAIPADIIGVSGRLRLNPAIDPNSGGTIWRLRDGIGATEPGTSVNNSIITSMIATINASTTLLDEIQPRRSAHGHATDLLTKVTAERLLLDRSISRSSATVSTLQETLASQGVDTDAELSRLLILEQAYSANARVIATVDSMLRTILEI